MRNGTKQNDAPFVEFYDMRAVRFVLPDEKWQMCRSWDCSGLFLYPD